MVLEAKAKRQKEGATPLSVHAVIPKTNFGSASKIAQLIMLLRRLRAVLQIPDTDSIRRSCDFAILDSFLIYCLKQKASLRTGQPL